MKAYAFRHQVIDLLKKGNSVTATAKIIGLPKSTLMGLTRVLMRQGYLPEDATEPAGKWSDADEERLIQLHRAGHQLKDIAASMTRSLRSIENKVKDLIGYGRLVKRTKNATRALKEKKSIVDDTPYEEDFSYAVYQYIATHPGCASTEIAAATGYYLERVRLEVNRLATGEGRLIERHGRRWQKYIDRVSDYAMTAASSRELKRIKEAA